jgi:hypothetical protein
MTHFKHIIILVLVLFTLGFTVQAQSTARFPFEGASHTYTCNGISVGANYDFYMAANTDGSGRYDDGLTGEFDFINNTTGTVGDDGLATTNIQWNTGAAAHIYYLRLEVTIPGGCSNSINLQITPQANMFDLVSENVPVDHTTSCPAVAAADGFSPLASAYDAGYSTLEFKVKRANSTKDWSFIPVLAVDPNLVALNNVIIKIEGANSGVITPDASKRYTVNALDSEVLVTVSIENSPGDKRVVTFKVTDQRESVTNLPDGDPSNDAVIHTIEIMPLINSMGGV